MASSKKKTLKTRTSKKALAKKTSDSLDAISNRSKKAIHDSVLKSLVRKMQYLFDEKGSWEWDPSDEMESKNNFWEAFYASLTDAEAEYTGSDKYPEVIREAMFKVKIPQEMLVSMAREFMMRGEE